MVKTLQMFDMQTNNNENNTVLREGGWLRGGSETD